MLKKVTPGQSLEIKADEWNAILEAAQAEINRRYHATGRPLSGGLTPDLVLAKNTSSEQLAPGQPVVLDGFSLAPVDLINTAGVTLQATAPGTEDVRPLAVAVDSCAPGKLGRFRVTGPAMVTLARLPDPDEPFVGFGPGGVLLPGQTGQARILASGTDFTLILLGSGHVSAPPASGMFQLLNVTTEGGPPTVRICDGALPVAAIAGIATINQQSYSCQATEFLLSETPLYFYLQFTPPQTTSAAEQTASACALVAMPDSAAVVSTAAVLYRLIGHAWTEPAGDRTIVHIVQDHPVGNLIATWYGRLHRPARWDYRIMITGLLKPVTVTRDAWLFPAIAAPWRKGLGAGPQHYPRHPMIVDAANLQTVLDDDTLHCVCNSLCCDRLTVFVRGSYIMPPSEEEILNLFDGHHRDYGLHLELRPLAGRCTLEIPIRFDITADISDVTASIVTDIRRQVSIIKNIRGVVFRDFNFNIRITLYCASADRDKIKYRLQSLLECVTNCPGCAFPGCTASITVTIQNLNRHKPRFIDVYEIPDEPTGGGGGGGPGWGSGNAGGGGSSWGSGPGTPGWGHDDYTWPGTIDPGTGSEPSPWLAFGEKDVVIRAAAFSNCQHAVFYDTKASIDIATDTLIGAESVATGWLNCGGWLHRLSQGNISNTVTVSGTGQTYTASDGSHGIADYDLTARSESRLIANSGGGEISTFAGSVSAIARCIAGNTPYHTAPSGDTTAGRIGGSALALSYGIIGNKGGTIAACDAICTARASHPVSHAALAAPYRSNTADLTANSGSRPYCDSNLPGWCEGNKS